MRNVQDIETIGMQLSPDKIWDVWSKGEVFGGNDPILWRRDACGAWIFRSHYGRKDSEYGWVVDRIQLVEDENVDAISNLRPMQWQNTIRKADGSIDCRVTSSGTHNDKPIDNTSDLLDQYMSGFKNIF